MNIIECHSVREILNFCSYNSILVFDLDNTIFRPTRAEDLASDQWCSQIFEQAFKIMGYPHLAIPLAVSICNIARKNVPIKLVEPHVKKIIKLLQDIGIPVLVLTARGGDEDIKITEKQLQQLDIDFASKWQSLSSFNLNVDPNRHCKYHGGIIYCDGKNKGVCLSAFLKKMNLKNQSITMLDDTKKNLIDVENELNKLGVKYTGLRYGFLDNRVATFDMARSMKYLLSIQSIFSKEEKETLLRLKIDIEASSEHNETPPQMEFSNN